MTSGIYTITCNSTGKCYVGSSVNIEKRWERHLKELHKGIHHCCKLQDDFNQKGENNFSLSILEHTSENLKAKEDSYIRKLDSKANGYNIADANFGDTLTHHPLRQERIEKMTHTLNNTIDGMSQEERSKKYGRLSTNNGNYNASLVRNCIYCSKSLSHSTINRRGNHCNDCRDRAGSNNPFYGKKHSEEVKQKLSKAMKGKRSYSKKVSANGQIFEAAKDCAAYFNISPSLVTYRVNSPKYPEWVRVNA